VRAAIEAGPLTDVEHLVVLRRLFLQASVPTSLDALQERLGLERTATRARDIGVLVSPEAPADRVHDTLLAQVQRPAEAVVPTGMLDAGVIERLRAAGIRVRDVRDVDVRHLDTPYVAALTAQPWDTTHLLHLALAAEAGRADGVATSERPGIRVAKAATQRAALVRRSCWPAGAGRPPTLDTLLRKGLRVVEIGSGVAS
jgi:hypothetical protein